MLNRNNLNSKPITKQSGLAGKLRVLNKTPGYVFHFATCQLLLQEWCPDTGHNRNHCYDRHHFQ
jgi:hypothetical protein